MMDPLMIHRLSRWKAVEEEFKLKIFDKYKKAWYGIRKDKERF